MNPLSFIADMATAVGRFVFASFRDGIGLLVAKLLGVFGLTMISMSAFLPDIKGALAQHAAAMPPVVMQFAGAIGLDVFMTMVISALSIRLASKVFIVPKGVADQLPGASR
ncbi:DUF2523 domain-containing protein [Lysobacter soli]|uniref:DUF2523 domain-containing protein n=1 Tax=Lysobacter soli TaxID=453783 RepID=A0A3D8VDN5_9GAMM|nr:DUF2523 family protein [Lysobacter soli]RDY67517.1 DUF2523 domain-containing protein [Lysobacter soli]